MVIPAVLAGKPPSHENYRLLETDGVRVYISGAISQKPGVQAVVNLHGFWLFQELEVRGLYCE